MTEPQFLDEPTEDDLAAIAAIVFGDSSKTIQERIRESPWLRAGRREAVEKWEQPNRLSRPEWRRLSR